MEEWVRLLQERRDSAFLAHGGDAGVVCGEVSGGDVGKYVRVDGD